MGTNLSKPVELFFFLTYLAFKDLNTHFLEEHIPVDSRHMKRCSSLSNQGNLSPAHNERSLDIH